VGKLADQTAQLFRQRHIGAQLGRFFRRQARHVERVGDTAVDQIIGHLFGHLQGNIDLRFGRRCAKVRGADEIGRAEQRVFLGRFNREHIERRARDLTACQAILQRCFVDQPAARAVDDADALFGIFQPITAQDIARLIGQGRVQRDKIGAAQQRVEIDLFHAHFDRAVFGQEGIIGDHLHAQPQRARCDDRPDIACADQAQRLAGQFHAHEPAFGPFARLRLRVGFGQLPREREHQRNRVFGGGDRIAERGVHHHHALAAGVGNIDVVDANPGAADHFQIGRRIKDRRRHLGRRTDRKAIIVADARDQLFGRFAGDHIDIAAALFKNARGVGVHLVGDEYFGTGHDLNPV